MDVGKGENGHLENRRNARRRKRSLAPFSAMRPSPDLKVGGETRLDTLDALTLRSWWEDPRKPGNLISSAPYKRKAPEVGPYAGQGRARQPHRVWTRGLGVGLGRDVPCARASESDAYYPAVRALGASLGMGAFTAVPTAHAAMVPSLRALTEPRRVLERRGIDQRRSWSFGSMDYVQ